MLSFLASALITCFPGQPCDNTIAQNDVNIPLPVCPKDFVGPLVGCGGRNQIVKSGGDTGF